MNYYSQTGRRDIWIRETGTGQQVTQLYEIYMMMMIKGKAFQLQA